MKQKITILFLWVISLQGVIHAQTSFNQLGSNINGRGGDAHFGTSTKFSADGKRLVIGGSGTANNISYVQVYEWDGTSWTQVGNDINGAIGERFGHAVDISKDGNRIIVGSYRGTKAQVFEWNGNVWTQIGATLRGYGYLGQYGYGYAVSMAMNGNRIAISDPEGSLNGEYVRTYDWDGTAWVHIGNSNGIKVRATSIDLSENGEYIVLGQPEGRIPGPYSNTGGIVGVYKYNSTQGYWSKDADIDGTYAYNDDFGFSVAVSDNGRVIAIGDNLGDRQGPSNTATIHNMGSVEVYRKLNSVWQLMGNTLYGDGTGTRSIGYSVSLSPDGKVLVTGGEQGVASKGETRIYTWSGNQWDLQDTILGEQLYDDSGTALNLAVIPNGELRVAIGSKENDDSGNNAGHVRVYTACSPIRTSPNSINQSGNSLSVNAGNNATYQWLNCTNNNTPITGATGANFMPGQSGTYAVSVTDNGCSATSTCYNFIFNNGKIIETIETDVIIYPNPIIDNFTLDFREVQQNIRVVLFDMSGKVIRQQNYENMQQITWAFESDLPLGVYSVMVQIDNQEPIHLKIIKE